MRLILLLFIPAVFHTQVWIRLSDFPSTKRDDGVAVVVNDKAYFGTGLQEWNATIDFRELDLNTYNWATIPNMPHTTERQYACAFAGTDCFYVFGGVGIGGVLNTVYRYDILAKDWSLVTPKPNGGLTGACSMQFGDKVIFSGGRLQGGVTNDEVWEYTISSDTWTQKGNFPFGGRWRACATVFNGQGYLMFGRDELDAFRKEVYKYDPSSDTWNKVSDFPGPARAYATLHGGSHRLVLFGGQDTTGLFYNTTWFYDPINNTWDTGPSLPGIGRRGGMTCIAGNDVFYSCGLGTGDKRLTETWKMDVPVGLKEEMAAKKISVHPNPCSGTFFIDLSIFGVTEEQLSLSLIDSFGRETNLKAPGNGPDFITDVDISSLPSGMYLLKVSAKGKLLAAKKIVKN